MIMDMKIKSFIYLDDYKMYSLSSQLFEGITQYILREDVKSVEEQHEQKGRLLSGKFMADMMFQKNANSEMRYLHDFAFNLFEKELEARNMLYTITSQTTISDLSDINFVRVKGKAIFEDYSKLLYTIEHFNEIGKAFGELQNKNLVDELEKANMGQSQIKDREQRNKIQQAIKKNQKQLEEEYMRQGYMIDENSRKNILKILDYGYRNNYEVRLSVDDSDTIYVAVINQDYLKEKEEVLISKYSRLTEREFTIIGVVSQTGNNRTEVSEIKGNDMKNATINLTNKIAGLEELFTGRSSNECIIDPIAIFTEL